MKRSNLLFAGLLLVSTAIAGTYGYQELLFLTKKPNDAAVELVASNTLKAVIDRAGMGGSVSVQRPPGLSSYGCERWKLEALHGECGTVFIQSAEKLTDIQVGGLVSELMAVCNDLRQGANGRPGLKKNGHCEASMPISSSTIALVFRTYSTSIEQDGSRRNRFEIYQNIKLRM